MPEIEAQDTECLVEYSGDVGFAFCAPRIYPPFCYTRCRENKGSKAIIIGRALGRPLPTFGSKINEKWERTLQTGLN